MLPYTKVEISQIIVIKKNVYFYFFFSTYILRKRRSLQSKENIKSTYIFTEIFRTKGFFFFFKSHCKTTNTERGPLGKTFFKTPSSTGKYPKLGRRVNTELKAKCIFYTKSTY